MGRIASIWRAIATYGPALWFGIKLAWSFYISRKKQEAVNEALKAERDRRIEAERQRDLDAARSEPIDKRRDRVLAAAVAAEIADRKRRADAK